MRQEDIALGMLISARYLVKDKQEKKRNRNTQIEKHGTFIVIGKKNEYALCRISLRLQENSKLDDKTMCKYDNSHIALIDRVYAVYYENIDSVICELNAYAFSLIKLYKIQETRIGFDKNKKYNYDKNIPEKQGAFHMRVQPRKAPYLKPYEGGDFR